MSSLLIFHIAVGSVCILSGSAALVYKKGAQKHRKAGLIFVMSMLAMTVSGTLLAYFRPAYIAVIAGVLTLYFVVTALLVVRNKPKHICTLDFAALPVVSGISIAAFYYGGQAASSPTGFIQGVEIPAGAYYFFAVIAAICALSDLRYLLLGGLSGAQRLARHLWRMGFALYIAVSSLFTGAATTFSTITTRQRVACCPRKPGYLTGIVLVHKDTVLAASD